MAQAIADRGKKEKGAGMTQDEIYEMAKEAGFDIDLPAYENGTALAIKLAKLVAAKATAKEREACAKVCDDAIFKIWEYDPVYLKLISRTVCTNLAKAIRARGEE